MKVLLVVPPTRLGQKKILGDFCPPAIPLGLTYIAAVLEQKGYSTKVLDMSVPGIGKKRLDELLAQDRPEIVGITSMTANFENALNVAKTVKNQNSNINTVMGGVHATFMHREILSQNPEVDAIIRFEGEYVTSELLEAYENRRNLREVKSISFRENGKVVSTPLREKIVDLDVLPYPAHHLLEPSVEEYVKAYGKRSFPVITTRGCPFGCIYCSTMAFHGRKYRTRSAPNVVGEIKYLIDQFEAENISFVDDNFTMQNQRVLALCEEIKKAEISIEWGCSARVDQISKRLLEKMRNAGCTDIFYGIESVSQRVLDKARKGFSTRQARSAVKAAEKLGIKTHCSFIIGLPGETKRTLKNMKKFVEAAKPSGRVLPNLLVVFPGTELAENKTQYFDQNQISYPDMIKTQLELVTSFYKINFGLNDLYRVVPPNIIIE